MVLAVYSKKLHILYLRDVHTTTSLNEAGRMSENLTSFMPAVQDHPWLTTHSAQRVRETGFREVLDVRFRVLKIVLVVEWERR